MNRITVSSTAMKKVNEIFFRLVGCLCPAALMAAQVSSDGPKDRNGDDVVTLAEFNVQAVQDGSYDAPDSLVGSRVRTEVRNLPYNLNIVTSEFIKDFAAFDLSEQLAYTSSFSNNQSENSYNIRGMAAGTILRNGFRAGALRSPISIARIEVIKGPVAAIYGQTDPSGLLNVITKRPKTRAEGSVRVTAGNYNVLVAEAEVTGPVGNASWLKDTYYLFSLSDRRENYETTFVNIHLLQPALVLTRKFGGNTALTLELDYSIQDGQRPKPLPYRQARVGTVTNYVGFAYDLYGFNYNSNQAYQDRHQGGAFLTFEHRFNNVFSMRTGLYYSANNLKTNAYTGDIVNDNPTRLINREPERANQSSYNRGGQLDFLAQFRTRSLEHKTSLMIDYSWQRSDRSNVRLANANLANPAYNVRVLNVDAPNYFLLDYSPENYPRTNSGLDNITQPYGAFLRHQVAAFRGRLIGVAGLRYDRVDFNLEDKARTFAKDVYSAHDTTYQLGLNFKATEELMLYANHSTSFTPQATNLSLISSRAKNEGGMGYETGIKGAFFDHRLNFTLNYFYTDRQNVRTTELELVPAVDTQGRPIIVPGTGQQRIDQMQVDSTTGLERAKGFELDFNWKMTPALQLFGGLGYADSFIVEAGRDREAMGRPPRSTPEYNGGGGARYALPAGPLKGVVFTVGVTYSGDAYFVAPTTGGRDTNADGFIDSNDGRRNLKTPGYTVWNAGASYQFRTGGRGEKRLVHRVQLNAKNLFDRRYVDTRMVPARRLNLLGSYEIRF